MKKLLLPTIALLFCTTFSSRASSFAPGNVVIYRVGDGTSPLASTGNVVYLDEYSTNGTLVQSMLLPSTAGDGNQLVANGTATSEGLITRSTDGKHLVFTGYRPNPFPYTSDMQASAGTAVKRVIGRVNSSGTLQTMALADFSSPGNPRAACSIDGNAVWMCGARGGVRYAAWGDATSVQITSNNTTNIRQVKIFGNQLFLSTASGDNRVVNSVSGGLPTTSNQIMELLYGLPYATVSSAYSFVMADLSSDEPGIDTLYVAFDTQNVLSKYCRSGIIWQHFGVVAASAYRGLDGVVNGNEVTLYATTGGSTATGGGTLASVTDTSGYQGTFSGSLTILANAGANTAFRGVAMAPVPEPAVLGLIGVALVAFLRRR